MSTHTVSIATGGPTRHIQLERVFIFRDLGGYPTRDGRTTRWQTLFRADGIHRLSEADVDTLRPLGLRTIIDLRTPDEVEEHGRFPLDSYTATYHHQPVLDVIWTPEQIETFGESPTFLVDRYREMLVIGDRALGESLRLFGASETYPAVFHCAAGKDRTGILAALVLGLLGVGDDVIAEDYALSRAGMAKMIAWVKENFPEAAERFGKGPSPLASAEPETILALLDHIRDEHGSLEAYVHTLGVEAEHIEGMRAALLG
jgi:protein-tyrosine phosphatase